MSFILFCHLVIISLSKQQWILYIIYTIHTFQSIPFLPLPIPLSFYQIYDLFWNKKCGVNPKISKILVLSWSRLSRLIDLILIPLFKIFTLELRDWMWWVSFNATLCHFHVKTEIKILYVSGMVELDYMCFVRALMSLKGWEIL